VLQKAPHSKRFLALRGHKTHLTSNVIAANQSLHLGLIVSSVSLQSGDAVLDHVPESDADLNVLPYALFRSIVRHPASPGESQAGLAWTRSIEVMLRGREI